MGTTNNLARTVDALCDLIDREALLAGDDAHQLLYRISRHCNQRRKGGAVRDGIASVIDREAAVAIDVVERHFGVARKLIFSKARPARVCLARNAAFMLLRTHTNGYLDDIGAALCRDRSTVIHDCNSIQQRLDTEPITKVMYEAAEKEFLERVKGEVGK